MALTTDRVPGQWLERRPVRLVAPPGAARPVSRDDPRPVAGDDARLTHLGVDPVEEAAYRAALERPSWTITDFAVRLAVPVSRAAEVVSRLAELDLVHTDADGGRLRPVDPQLGLTALIARREAEMVGSWYELERGRLAAANLAADFDAARRSRIDGALDVAYGPEPVRARIAALVSQARTEVVSMVVSGSGYVDPVALPRRADLAGRSVATVRFRTVAMDQARHDPLMLRYLHGAVSDGVEVRTAAEVPMSALVVDATAAVVPLVPAADRRRVGAVVLHLPGVVATTMELFERVWAEATPLDQATEGRDVPDDDARKLLALMLAGYTDKAAAAKLDVSVRTVGRQVAELMERLGSASRFQAGALAAERGWITAQMLRDAACGGS